MAEPEERFYTVEQANAAVEDLREALARIRESRLTILRAATRIKREAVTNGGGEDGPDYWAAMRALREEIEALAAQGIILRDADTGLIDFPSRREGRLVYLCWRPDEDRVGFWHEVNTGFGGRRPLDA